MAQAIIEIKVDGSKAISTINELNAEIKKQNELLSKAKIGSEEYNNAAASIGNLKKAQKELTTEMTKAEKAQQRQIDAMEKERQKMEQLRAAAVMEIRTEEDMIIKKNALVALRKKVDRTTAEGIALYDEMGTTILGLNNELIKFDESINMHQRKVGNYQGAVDTVNMSLGEMKKALRELKNESFAGKSEEEVKALREEMARLTEGIRDFQEQNAAASESGIPAFVAGLQGIVASVQLVTGTLSLFGIENEKLEKGMVQLIGVSQALATVEDIYARGKVQVMLATVKDTIAKAANAVAAKGQAMATTGATAATRLLGRVMATNPYTVVIAGAVALAAVLAALIIKMNSQKDLMKETRENANKAAGEIQAEQFAMNNLFEAIKKTNVGSTERAKLVKELNETYGEYLPSLVSEKDSLEKIDVAQKAANESLRANIFMKAKRAELEAVESKLAELYTEQRKSLEYIAKIQSGEIARVQSSTRDNLKEEEGSLEKINREIAIQEGLWNDISKYYDKMIPAAVNMTKEQAAALEAYNTALRIKSEKEKEQDKANEAYKQFNQTLTNINTEYELNIYFGKTRIEQLEAEKKKAEDLFNLYKTFYAEGGYTGDELAKLEALKNTVVSLTELLGQTSIERLDALKLNNEATTETINTELQAWMDAENIKEELRKDQQSRQEQADAEELARIKAKYADWAALTTDTMGEIGGIIGDSIEEQGFNIEKFGKKLILLGLDILEKQVSMAVAASAAASLAQPDSVATFGATGLARAAVLAGLIKAAFSVTKAIISSGFAEGGYTGSGGKYEPAGTVHKGEVVFSQSDVAQLGGASVVDRMRPTSKANYYTGGIVGNMASPAAAQQGQMLAAIRAIRPVVTVEDINAVMMAENNRLQISVI